jgi:site-specific recombinase XerD
MKKHFSNLKQALTYINKNPRKITLRDIEQWKYEGSVNRQYEIATVVHNLLILRLFLKYIGNKRVANEMEIPKCPKTIPPEKEIWLLPEEQDAMIKKSRELGIRTEAMVRLFLCSGVRVGELQNIELTDINFEEHEIHIKHGKGDKSRFVYFVNDTEKALLRYLEVRKEPIEGIGQPLFTTNYGTRPSYTVINKRVKECAILAGINKNITPHKLRHTCITTVIETTKDIPFAQKLAGHSDIKTTMRYHHSTHKEVQNKYMKYFDTPITSDIKPQMMTNDEILRVLDTKFLNGDVPRELYIKLRTEYENKISRENTTYKKSSNIDVAYQ